MSDPKISRYVHASIDANRISLVMRDRNTSASTAASLVQRLRGQLRAGGLELAHLILNGQDVTGGQLVDGTGAPLVTNISQ